MYGFVGNRLLYYDTFLPLPTPTPAPSPLLMHLHHNREKLNYGNFIHGKRRHPIYFLITSKYLSYEIRLSCGKALFKTAKKIAWRDLF